MSVSWEIGLGYGTDPRTLPDPFLAMFGKLVKAAVRQAPDTTEQESSVPDPPQSQRRASVQSDLVSEKESIASLDSLLGGGGDVNVPIIHPSYGPRYDPPSVDGGALAPRVLVLQKATAVYVTRQPTVLTEVVTLCFPWLPAGERMRLYLYYAMPECTSFLRKRRGTSRV